MGVYDYNLFNTQFNPKRLIMLIEANSPGEAIKKAGFDWVSASGGKIEKTRKGAGYTNTAIKIYFPETLNANEPLSPDFVFERIM